MKWAGMSGVGGQKPLIRGPLVVCILLVLLLARPHHCAHHPTLTAGAVKLRPERASLTPPTVTSLRPPDKGGNGKIAVGLTVRGEQSSSNSPPVVASRSPSSTTYLGYPHHNIQKVTPYHGPTAPIATAASGSRTDTSLSEQPSLADHQQTVFVSKAQSTPALTQYGIRVSAGTSPPSSSYKSAHPGVSVTRRYPKHAIPETVEKSETLNVNPGEAEGGWAQTDTEAVGGVWGETGTNEMSRTWRKRDHNPYSSHGRHDTFGHNITEDFTHLENEYVPQTSRGRGTNPIYSSSSDIDNSAHNSRTHIYPQEEGVTGNSDRHYPYQQPHEFTETSRNIEHRNTERKATNRNTQPTTIIPNRPLSMKEVTKLLNMTEIEELLLFIKKKGITLHQLIKFVNRIPPRQEFFNFFDRPDITTSTLSTTHEPQISTKPFNETPTHFSLSDEDYKVTVLRKKSHLSTKSSETSHIPIVPKLNSDTSFSEGVVNDSIISDASYNYNTPLSTSPEDELEDDKVTKETLTTEDEQEQKRNRKKNRKDRGKKRKKKERKNKKQGGRKRKPKIHPDLVYTTVILPLDSDVNDTQTLVTQVPSTPKTISTVPPTSTVSMLSEEPPVSTVELGTSNSSTETSISPLISFPNETPIVTLPSVMTRKSSVAQATVPTSLPNSTKISFSIQPTTSSSSSITTLKATLIPTTLPNTSTTMMEKNPPASRTMPPSMPEGPQTDSLTLPPPSKISEVSIISVAVMEVPTNETRKSTGDETVPEYSKPMRKRPTEHTPVPTPKKTENEIGRRTKFMPGQQKDDYIFPIKGILIISGVMGALAVFTLVVLISYAVIKCSKKPVVNNYQVSEQKPTA